MDKPSQAGRVARSRATIYRALARALSPPNEALCGAVLDGSLLSAVQAAMAGASPAHRDCLDPRWVSDLASHGRPDAWSEAMAIEHTRLFSSGLVCPHYEADFVAGDSFRSMHIIAEVVDVYATFGVKVSAGAAERPDHIAIELEFMSWLASKEAHACAQAQDGNARLCRGAQRVFFEKHLGRWGRAAAHALREAAKAPFYRAAASLLETLVVADAKYLRVDLTDLELRHRSAGARPDSATEGGAKPCGGCSACSA